MNPLTEISDFISDFFWWVSIVIGAISVAGATTYVIVSRRHRAAEIADLEAAWIEERTA